MSKNIESDSVIVNDFRNLVLEFFESLDSESHKIGIIHDQRSSTLMCDTKNIFLPEEFQVSFWENDFGDELGETVIGIRKYSEDSELRFPYFQRRFYDHLTKEYINEEALYHLKGVMTDLNGEKKCPNIAENLLLSDILCNVAYVWQETEDLYKKWRVNLALLKRWIEDSKDADLILISVGSGSQNEQQYPIFAKNFAQTGKKVAVLNMDFAFAGFHESYRKDESLFLKEEFTAKKNKKKWAEGNRQIYIYRIIKDFVTEAVHNSRVAIVLSSYCYPLSHSLFQEIINQNQNCKNLGLIQGYFQDHNPVIILDKEKVAKNFYKENMDSYEKIWALDLSREETQNIAQSPIFEGSKVFFRLEELVNIKDFNLTFGQANENLGTSEVEIQNDPTAPAQSPRPSAFSRFSRIIPRMLGRSKK